MFCSFTLERVAKDAEIYANGLSDVSMEFELKFAFHSPLISLIRQFEIMKWRLDAERRRDEMIRK